MFYPFKFSVLYFDVTREFWAIFDVEVEMEECS